MDLRKMLKSSLSGVCEFRSHKFSSVLKILSYNSGYVFNLLQVDKSISAMYKKLQKNLTSEELLPSLWDKCKV